MVHRKPRSRVLTLPESLTPEAQLARLAVLGSPISHSRSPRIHRAAYAQLGLPWRYTAVRIGESGLGKFLATRGEEWRGFSVTMPLKAEAYRLSAVLDPVARESGVVNTLLRVLGGSGEAPTWAGFNTDVAGLAAALRSSALNLTHTIVLGAGATAVSAILAARELGAERITVLARRADAAKALAERFDTSSVLASNSEALARRGSFQVRGLGWADSDTAETVGFAVSEATAVISTLPGAAGERIALPTGISAVPLFDVAYDPWPSPLAERWKGAGAEAHAGIDMLVEQALVQVRIFVGGDPTFAVADEGRLLATMRDAGVGR
ncbi:shikimate dehydrogenase family protein [Leucobacter sp. W1478]|uniref:shikimate dehydrogenase family protein n=1 Tax=Leucobacter sp. W1478 TaxID=3439065 RepID=UPI003F2B06DA